MCRDLKAEQREKVEVTLSDLRHVEQVANPKCDDHHLRRMSVQLRSLLVDKGYVESWKILPMETKHPTIVAPRLRPDDLEGEEFAVAGGGNVGGITIAKARFTPRVLSPQEIKEQYERDKADVEYPFPAGQFMDSCAVYFKGIAINRRQLIQYVAHKKGGAHLDHSRKKDDAAFVALDEFMASGPVFGGAENEGDQVPGKNAVYLELISIGQLLVASPDTRKFMSAAEIFLKGR